jgi:hypothetical protein
MKGVFAVASLLLWACDERIPGLCKHDSDCPASSSGKASTCYQGICVAAADLGAGDAGIPSVGADGGLDDAGVPDAGLGALGDPCSAAAQCGSGFCVDGVCCEVACSDELCQRCDSASSTGKGHCGWNINRDDPDHECPGTSATCLETCNVLTTTFVCSGSGFACSSSRQLVTPVPSGKICQGGAAVPVSKTAYCAAANDCADGRCAATQWWTSCDGKGACRISSDRTASYSEPIYAGVGASLTNACATTGTTLCSVSRHCVGQHQFQGYFCAGDSDSCNVDAVVSGCCNCGGYACDSASDTCKTMCLSDVDCATGYRCIPALLGLVGPGSCE